MAPPHTYCNREQWTEWARVQKYFWLFLFSFGVWGWLMVNGYWLMVIGSCDYPLPFQFSSNLFLPSKFLVTCSWFIEVKANLKLIQSFFSAPHFPFSVRAYRGWFLQFCGAGCLIQSERAVWERKQKDNSLPLPILPECQAGGRFRKLNFIIVL